MIDKIETNINLLGDLLEKTLIEMNNTNPTASEILKISDAVGQYERLIRVRKERYLKDHSEMESGDINNTEKEYEKKLPNGTLLNVKISAGVENFSPTDYEAAFSSFAQCSRDFYLRTLKLIMNINNTEVTQ